MNPPPPAGMVWAGGRRTHRRGVAQVFVIRRLQRETKRHKVAKRTQCRHLLCWCMPQARRSTSPARSSPRIAAAAAAEKKMNVLAVDGAEFDTTSWVADAVKGFAAELPKNGLTHLRDTLSEFNGP